MTFVRLSRLREGYKQLDQILEATMQEADEDGLPVPCAEGCAHCCFQPIPAYDVELDACVEEYAKVYGAEALKDLASKAEAQLLRVRHVNSPVAYLRLHEPCVFLVDNRCSVYSARPFACRTYYVVGTAEQCVNPRGIQRILEAPRATAKVIEIVRQLDIQPFGSLWSHAQWRGALGRHVGTRLDTPFQRLVSDAVSRFLSRKVV